VTDVTLLLRRTPRADVYEFPAPPTMKFDVDDDPEAPPRDDDDDAHC
jgi:hypothetical protein